MFRLPSRAAFFAHVCGTGAAARPLAPAARTARLSPVQMPHKMNNLKHIFASVFTFMAFLLFSLREESGSAEAAAAGKNMPGLSSVAHFLLCSILSLSPRRPCLANYENPERMFAFHEHSSLRFFSSRPALCLHFFASTNLFTARVALGARVPSSEPIPWFRRSSFC